MTVGGYTLSVTDLQLALVAYGLACLVAGACVASLAWLLVLRRASGGDER